MLCIGIGNFWKHNVSILYGNSRESYIIETVETNYFIQATNYRFGLKI